MSGRRSYPRYNITPSSEGVLRVLRDVTIQRADGDEFLIVGREAGIVGDAVTIEIADGDRTFGAKARVVESVPVIIDGSVRHRLRLRRVPDPERGADGQPGVSFGEAR